MESALKSDHPLPLWEATYYFPSPSSDGRVYEQKTSIIYQSAGPKSAVFDALRWWDNRHESMPDYFSELWALKVYAKHFGELQENGYLSSSHAGTVFEAKYDSIPFGFTFYQEAEIQTERFER